jgi:hypothetical protein
VWVDRVVPSGWEQALRLLVSHVRRATGLDLDASLRWVSAEEEGDIVAEMNRRLSDPDARAIGLGSADADREVLPLDSYHGHWVLELPGETASIVDEGQLADVIEDYVIEAVWLETGLAPRPGFLDGM